MWTVDNAWAGKTVVCVAGGPSLNLRQVRAIGMKSSAGRIFTIAINDAVYPCWFADTLYACDAKWWKLHSDTTKFPGQKLSGEATSFDGVMQVKFTGPDGFDFSDPDGIRTGGNGGYQVIQIAAKRGARRVLLVGYDMHDGPNEHWFGLHPKEISGTPDMSRRRASFNALADAMKVIGVDVVNCSPGSALHAFRHGDLETELP